VAKGAAAALASVERSAAVPILMKGLSVRRTQATTEIVRSLYRTTREDPGADIDVVGWRRGPLDAARWKEWGAKSEADTPRRNDRRTEPTPAERR